MKRNHIRGYIIMGVSLLAIVLLAIFVWGVVIVRTTPGASWNPTRADEQIRESFGSPTPVLTSNDGVFAPYGGMHWYEQAAAFLAVSVVWVVFGVVAIVVIGGSLWFLGKSIHRLAGFVGGVKERSLIP